MNKNPLYYMKPSKIVGKRVIYKNPKSVHNNKRGKVTGSLGGGYESSNYYNIQLKDHKVIIQSTTDFMTLDKEYYRENKLKELLDEA